MHWPVGFQFPQYRAVAGREAIEMFIIGADQDSVTNDDGRRLDFTARFEGPKPFAIRRVDGVQNTREISAIDHAIGNSR